ncbi:NAD(P)/FAD-dependent oxidoreductase [Piscinibacter sp.]|uniref:NAD(P)/FAD-dependent oxidoreductase n=1 Tax=Piscinibacter sp. TaxID=1903157 RepID=UPI002C512F46|nr:NAD(P)/FAD-dependent oxidoreductase [Albitalea sp.]HUG24785.1 NAD(P)/FAD-dependent oxidoreductase [Albitalea sp.]
MPRREVVDALVVGGGPAGLAAALYLARFRRRVLVVEHGESRAAKIPCTHNYPGFPDGISGAALLTGMRLQARRHEVQFAAGRVTSLERIDGGFRARWADGEAEARTVVLATGVTDVPPAMPHLVQAMLDGALRYCPVCDGYEVAGLSVGLLADSGDDTSEALYLRHFTDRVTLFVSRTGVDFSGTQRQRMAQAGVRLVESPVTRIRRADAGVAVQHGGAEEVVASLYGALGIEVHSQLAANLGAEHDGNGYLLTDHHHQTRVAGLYAVGDVVKGLNQIAVATGGAAIAASAIHLALMEHT